MTGEGWTITEACEQFRAAGMPVDSGQFRRLVTILRIQPVGETPSAGRGGRGFRLYPIAELQRVHAACAPWLVPHPPASGSRHVPLPDRTRRSSLDLSIGCVLVTVLGDVCPGPPLKGGGSQHSDHAGRATNSRPGTTPPQVPGLARAQHKTSPCGALGMPPSPHGDPSARQGKDAAMTGTQGWILVIEVGIIALAYLIGLFRGPWPRA